MTTFKISFTHLNRQANSVHNVVEVEAESLEGALAKWRRTWRRTIPTLGTVSHRSELNESGDWVEDIRHGMLVSH